MKYYLQQGDETTGPWTRRQVAQLIDVRQVDAETPCLPNIGDGTWGRLDHFFNFPRETPAPHVKAPPENCPPAVSPPRLASNTAAPLDAGVPSPSGGEMFVGTFFLLSLVLAITGLVLVTNGMSSAANEATLMEQSAIRETFYAVQYGSGFIVIGLALLLAVLTRLFQAVARLQKERRRDIEILLPKLRPPADGPSSIQGGAPHLH